MITDKTQEQGFILPMLLSFIIAISIVISAVALLLSSNFQTANNANESQKAFNIAEAGINYYAWHLNHNAADFKDGKTTPTTPDATLGYGPYVHDYIDDNAKKIGTYTLWVKPQGNGSTIATVRAVGTVDGSKFKRTVEAQVGAPSFASYSVASDGALWFGNTESANGPVHSNQGVRMDGASSDNVTSAKATYVAPDNLGGNGSASFPGVWCSTSITTPTNCNTRSKVDWLYPVSTLDFNQVSSSLCTLKKNAFSSDSSTSALATQANACTNVSPGRTPGYLPQRSTSFSNLRGYMIELLPTGKYNLYNVNDEDDSKASYSTALTTTAVASNITIPANGVIFAEDNVWVRSSPTFSGRVTIGAGRLATTYAADINIADDIIYGSKSGTDAIGLVAENDVTVMPYAPPQTGAFNFEVDAAVIAQSGSVTFRDKYVSNSNNCTKGWNAANQTYLYYGSISTRQLWTWTYLVGGSACGSAINDTPNGYLSGIKNNVTQYDYNLLYAPPPSFPLTSGFNILQWHEVVTKP